MTDTDGEKFLSGSIPYSAGVVSFVRIPIPGSPRLAVELNPRGHVPKSGSTSSLFIQDKSGKQHLRLDYGYNKNTNTIDFHWNQKGVYDSVGIENHTPAGRGAGLLHKSAKAVNWVGRRIVIVGLAVDSISIVVASNPIRRATEVVSAWAGAWAGCKVVGAGGARVGATVGTFVLPGKGTAIGIGVGGIGGCIIGGIGGYRGGEQVGRVVYQWAESTNFTRLPAEPVEAQQ